VRERQPFGGPLFVRFGSREHAIGGQLAGAMRVEVQRSEGRPVNGEVRGAAR
jgi:Fe2+ transport system protein FeoA